MAVQQLGEDLRGVSMDFSRPITEIAIGRLSVPSAWIRSAVDDAHVSVLAQVLDETPPLLVRRETNEIIDGVHRYYAALRSGRTSVRCVQLDCDWAAALLEALRRNVQHGLPLSLHDRERAARTLLESCSAWSDRRIASACALAPGTIARLRRSSAQFGRLNTLREGADGRRRPVDAERVRVQIASALRTQPSASLREIARLVGTSPTTVRSVKAQIRSQDSAASGSHETVQARVSAETAWITDPPVDAPVERAVDAASPNWLDDQALGGSPNLVAFRDWFVRTGVVDVDPDEFIREIPVSRVYEIVDEARRRASWWMEFGRALEGKVARSIGRA